MLLKDCLDELLAGIPANEMFAVNYFVPREGLEFEPEMTPAAIRKHFENWLNDEVTYYTTLENEEDVKSLSDDLDTYKGSLVLYNDLAYSYDHAHRYDPNQALIVEWNSGEPMKVIYLEFAATDTEDDFY